MGHLLKTKRKQKLKNSPQKGLFFLYSKIHLPLILLRYPEYMSKVQSIIENGNRGVAITVECRLSNSLPTIVIVGFTHRSVTEARERIRGALAASKIPLPRKRITINLAPADIPKEGSSFDLAILIAILAAAGLVRTMPNSATVILGEVGLDGSIRPIRGIIGKILAGKQIGITTFWIPHDNLAQANLIPNVQLVAFKTVSELYAQLNTDLTPKAAVSKQPLFASTQLEEITFDNISGQDRAKRALLIAAAGNHNAILSGPPGSGKSMLARALSDIMPGMTPDELLHATHLHSLAGRNFEQIILKRPFRAPHHSASLTAIVGGGQTLRPGEISLSHAGVLFFDEFMEFSRHVIEALRQPLEDKTITINHQKNTAELPADFLFIAATNPCPCGFYGSSKPCICSPYQIAHYNKKLSGPVLDRIDLYIDVDEVAPNKLLMSHNSKAAAANWPKLVQQTRRLQYKRAGKLNNQLTNTELAQLGQATPNCITLLNRAANQLQLSSRGYIRALRLARTIADLEKCVEIDINHMSEALQYRSIRSPS